MVHAVSLGYLYGVVGAPIIDDEPFHDVISRHFPGKIRKRDRQGFCLVEARDLYDEFPWQAWGAMLTASSRIMARLHDFPRYDLREVHTSRLIRLEVCQNTLQLGNLAQYIAAFVAVSATRVLLG